MKDLGQGSRRRDKEAGGLIQGSSRAPTIGLTSEWTKMQI